MTPPPAPRKPRAPRQDAILAQSVELARDAAVHAADHPDDVGDFAGLVMEGERLAALQFAATMRGYVGWN